MAAWVELPIKLNVDLAYAAPSICFLIPFRDWQDLDVIIPVRQSRRFGRCENDNAIEKLGICFWWWPQSGIVGEILARSSAHEVPRFPQVLHS